jgi:hypothetical protein
VTAKTTPARLNIQIAEIPGLGFRALFFRTFEYFVYGPGSIAFFVRTCDNPDDFHLSSWHVWPKCSIILTHIRAQVIKNYHLFCSSY